jgi:hypothetical protein
MVLENMLDAETPKSRLAIEDGTPGLSAGDLKNIIQLAVSSERSETIGHFSEDIYNRCLRPIGLDASDE